MDLRKAWVESGRDLFPNDWSPDPFAVLPDPACVLVGPNLNEDWSLVCCAYVPGRDFVRVARLQAMDAALNDPLVCEGRCLHLCDLQVDEDYRRQGIGSWVLAQVVILAEDRGYAELTGDISPVDRQDGKLGHLVAFYGRAGFQVRPHPERAGWRSIWRSLADVRAENVRVSGRDPA